MKIKLHILIFICTLTAFNSYSQSTFRPSDIDSLVLWVKADSAIVLNDTIVTSWDDVSGHNDSLYQTSTTQQPVLHNSIPILNNLPVVHFDGTDDYLNFTFRIGDIRTVFMVLKEEPGAPALCRLILGDPTTFDFHRGDDCLKMWGSNTNINVRTGITRINEIQIDGTLTNMPTTYSILSLSTVGNVGASNLSLDRTFTSRVWDGDIAEVIIYDRVLLNSERDSVESYLRNKYAPPVNLGPDVVMTGLCADTLHASPRFLSYLWSDGSTDSNLIFYGPGTYSVTVTDVFGFTSTDAVNVTYPLNQFSDTTLCAGSTIVWNTNLSGPAYTFQWSDGSTLDSLSITAAGQYSVTATEVATGCSLTSRTDTVTLDNFPNIVQIDSAGSDSIHICAGQIIGLAFGAAQSVSYLWGPNNETTPTIAISTGGLYWVTVHDAQGCMAQDTVTVHIAGTAPVIDFTAPDTCLGDSTRFAGVVLSSDSVATWSWNFGDTNSGAGQNVSHLYAAAGTDTVTLTVVDTAGCGNTLIKITTINPVPVAGFTFVQPLCQGNAIQFTDASINPDTISWSWNFGDPTSGSNTSTQQSPSHDFTSAGSFTVSLTVTSTHSSCASTVQHQVNVIPNNNCVLPNAINGLALWLAGDSVTLNGSQVQTWRDLSNGNNAVQNTASMQPLWISPNPILNYHHVLGFDSVNNDYMIFNTAITNIRDCFFVIKHATGNQDFTPILGSSSSFDFVGGAGTLLFDGTNASPSLLNGTAEFNGVSTNNVGTLIKPVQYSILSFYPTGNLRAQYITNDRGFNFRYWHGDYAEVILYDSVLDATQRGQVMQYLRNKYAPPVDLGPDIAMTTLCDTVLNASPRFLHYQWSTSLNDTLPTLTVSAAGTYSVTVTDVFGFTSTDNVVITYPLNQLPDTNILCAGNSLVWNTNLNNPAYTFQWSDGSTLNSLPISSAGLYSVTVTEVATGCILTSRTDTVTIDNFPNIVEIDTSGSGSISICSGQTIGLYTGASQAVSYLWGPNNEVTPTITINNGGTYNVTVSDVQGCIGRDTVTVNIAGSAPIIDFTAPDTCLGDSTHFVGIVLSGSITSWNWDFGDSNTGTGQTVSHLYAASGTDTVTLTVIDTSGCGNRITKTTTILPVPVAGFTFTQILCHGDTVQFTDASTGAISWNWDFGDPASGNDTSTLPSPVHVFSSTGSFTVQLTVASANGCTSAIQQQVNVISNNCLLPSSIGGLTLWFAGDSVVANTDSVHLWKDLSGNNNNAIQNTPANQPLWGSPNPILNYHRVLSYDGTNNNYMAFNPVSNIRDCFFVIKHNGDSSFSAEPILGHSSFFDFHGNSDTLLFTPATTSDSIILGSMEINGIGISPAVANKPAQYSILSLYPIGTLRAEYITNDRNFNFRYWNGDYAEVIVYDTVLDATQRGQVMQYLRNKYAPPVNLGPDIAMTTLCPLTLNASPRFLSYLWSDGSMNQTLVVHAPGTYSVTVTDVFGFTSTDAVNVTYPLNQFADTTLCAGDTFVWHTNLSSLAYTFQWSDGSTLDSLPIITGGLYSVTVTEVATGCTLTSRIDTVTLDNFPVIAVIDTVDSDTLCGGESLGLLYGASQAVSYSWTPYGQSTPTIVVDTSNEYSVTVFDASGCRARDTVQITVNGIAPSVDFITANTCLGNPTTFIGSISPPDSILSWNWDFGDSSTDTGQAVSHLYASVGVYSVKLTVTDTAGCRNFTIKTDSVFTVPTAAFTFVQQICHGDTVDFTDASTDTLVAWSWNFGDPSSGSNNTSSLQNPSHVFTSSSSFIVQLTVSSVHGCTATIQNSVFVIPNNDCTLPSSLPGLVLWLEADSSHLATGSLVDTLYDMSGYSNNAVQGTSTSQPTLISPVCVLNNHHVLRFDSLYKFMQFDSLSNIRDCFFVIKHQNGLGQTSPPPILGHRTYHDFHGSADSKLFDPFDASLLVLSAHMHVNGTSILGQTAVKPKNYSIISIFPDSSLRAEYITNDRNLSAGLRYWNGDYAEIIIFDTALAPNQRIQVEEYLHNKYAPPVNLGPDIATTSLCPVILNASCRFIKYTWNGVAADSDTVFTVTRPGTYSVVVTDVFGYTSTDTVNVTYPLNQVATNQVLCAHDTFTWDTQLNPAYSFDWHGGNSTGPVLTTDTGGDYYVIVTDTSSGCVFTSDTVHIRLDSLPLIAAIATQDSISLCSGNTLGLIAGTSIYTYVWQDSITTDSVFVVQDSGWYWVYVTDSFGCTRQTDPVYVSINGQAPTVIFSSSTACQGDSMLFINSSIANDGTIDSVQWNFGDPASGINNASSSGSVNHLYTDTLPHIVTLTVHNTFGCSNHLYHIVQVIPKPHVNFGVDNACSGVSIQFHDSSTSSIDSLAGWQWNFGDPISGSNNSSMQNPTHQFDSAGNYFVSLIATTNLGCADTGYRQVVVHHTVIASFVNNAACFGSLMIFTGTGASLQDNVSWHWTFGDGGQSNIDPTSHFYTSPGPYLVSLSATTSFGCVDTASHYVNVSPRPFANFNNALAPCINNPYTFVDASGVTTGSIQQWYWNIVGVGALDSVQAPVYTFDSMGTYSVQLTVTSDAGCTSTVTKPITVQPLPVPGFVFFPPYGTPPLLVGFTNQSTGASSYQWNFGDNGTSTALAPQHTFVDTGNFCINLTAISSLGCKDSVMGCIYVIQPRRDVAVQDISATAINNTLRISALIANLGTLAIDSVQMKASLPDGTSIEEVYGITLATGTRHNYNFEAALTIPVSSNHDYYCVEATILPLGLTDDVPSNNKRCESIVNDYSIVEPYPNPFIGTINLDVVLPYDDHLTIELFNGLGQQLQLLYDGAAVAGLNSISADLSTLAEGMYAVRFTFRDNVKVRQVIKASRKK